MSKMTRAQLEAQNAQLHERLREALSKHSDLYFAVLRYRLAANVSCGLGENHAQARMMAMNWERDARKALDAILFPKPLTIVVQS